MLTLIGLGLVSAGTILILVTLLMFFYGVKIKAPKQLAFWWFVSFAFMGAGLIMSCIGTFVLRENLGG